MTRPELLALGLAMPFARSVLPAREKWRTFEITTEVVWSSASAKVQLEERSNGPLDDPYLAGVRERLFESREMNWIAFNDSHDVTLPGSTGKPLPFFIYPCAEFERQHVDSLDAERFRYRITAPQR
jgi:hypothetical protein